MKVESDVVTSLANLYLVLLIVQIEKHFTRTEPSPRAIVTLLGKVAEIINWLVIRTYEAGRHVKSMSSSELEELTHYLPQAYWFINISK